MAWHDMGKHAAIGIKELFLKSLLSLKLLSAVALNECPFFFLSQKLILN
jgi:hypothetical protein